MPEEVQSPVAPQGDTPPVQAGDNGDQPTAPVDFSKLTDDQFVKVLEDPRLFKLDRIADLREKAKKATEYEKQQQSAEEERLKKQGEYQTLAEKATAERDEWKNKYSTAQIDNRIVIAAQKAGAVDTNAVLKLIDRQGIQTTETGDVAGVDEAVAALLENSPYLRGNGAQQPVGSPSNPSGNPTQPVMKFKASQLRDSKFYADNEKEILIAMQLGLIEDDES